MVLLLASASLAERGHADDGVGRSVFIDGVNRGIAVDRRGDIELINVINVNRHHGGVETAVTRRGSHRDVVAGSGFPVEQRAVVDGDHPADRIDLEPTASVIVQCVSDRAVDVASASLVNAVTPTTVLVAAFSSTALIVASLSIGVVTSNSSTSLTLIVITAVSKLPSLDVARTVMLWLAAASRSSSVPLSTVTTPLTASILNLPPACVVQRVGDRAVGRIRVARKRGHTDDGVGRGVLVDGVNRGVAVDRRGDIELVDVVNVDRHHRGVETAVTRRGSHGDVVAGSGFAIEQRAIVNSDDTTNRIDFEPSASVIVQCVSNRAVGRIRVARKRGHTDDGVGHGVLVDGVNRGVAVDRRGDIELIDVVNVDRHHGSIKATVTRRGSHRDVVIGGGFAVEQRAVVNGDHTADRIDLEPSTSVIVQCVSNRAVGRIRVARERGYADHRVGCSALVDGINRGVAVDQRGDIELINVIDVNRHHGGVETAVTRRCSHRDVVASSGFPVEQRAVVNSDDTTNCVDFKPTAGGVVERVGDGVVAGIRVARECGYADHRVSRSVLVDGIDRGVAVGRRGDIELINVIDVNRHHGGVETAVTRRCSHRDVVASSGFPVEQRAVVDSDDTTNCVDFKPTAGGVVERVGDGVVAGIRVARECGYADHRVSRSVLVDGIDRGVAVGRRGDIELIDVVNVDRHHRGVETAVTRRGSHRDVVASSGFPVEQRAVVDGDHPADGIDFEPSAGGVVERVGDGVVAGIRVARECGYADHRVSRSVLVDGIDRGVAVGRRGDIELIDVVNVDRHHRGVETAVTRRGSHGDVVAGSGFPVEQRAVVNSDHTTSRIDFEPSTSVIVQCVSDRTVAGIRVARECGHADHRVSRSVLIDSVNRGIAVDRRGDIELIDVVNVDRHHRGVETAVTRRGSHGDVVAGSGFPVEQRAVVDGDHPAERNRF